MIQDFVNYRDIEQQLDYLKKKYEYQTLENENISLDKEESFIGGLSVLGFVLDALSKIPAPIIPTLSTFFLGIAAVTKSGISLQNLTSFAENFKLKHGLAFIEGLVNNIANWLPVLPHIFSGVSATIALSILGKIILPLLSGIIFIKGGFALLNSLQEKKNLETSLEILKNVQNNFLNELKKYENSTSVQEFEKFNIKILFYNIEANLFEQNKISKKIELAHNKMVLGGLMMGMGILAISAFVVTLLNPFSIAIPIIFAAIFVGTVIASGYYKKNKVDKLEENIAKMNKDSFIGSNDYANKKNLDESEIVNDEEEDDEGESEGRDDSHHLHL